MEIEVSEINLKMVNLILKNLKYNKKHQFIYIFIYISFLRYFLFYYNWDLYNNSLIVWLHIGPNYFPLNDVVPLPDWPISSGGAGEMNRQRAVKKS